MTTVLVPVDGVLDVIIKAAGIDQDAADELWRITLFEALCDLTDTYAPMLERDFAKAAAVQEASARRGLVRSFIGKRMNGEDVDELTRAAAMLTVLEVFGKADEPTVDAYNQTEQGHKHPKNAAGRWARRFDHVRAFVAPQGARESDLARVTRGSSGTDRRIYRQLSATGSALAASGVGTGNAHAALVGSAAALVGELGPQAENVLGPGLKRTAYRYRGTERRPSRAMQNQSKKLNDSLDRLANLERENPAAAAELRTRMGDRYTASARPSDIDAAIGAVLTAPGSEQLSSDQLRLRAQSDFATLQLAGQIPDLKHAKLSLEAGQLPPSVGVIIDADGDIVSEAMGHNGDHYLPYDLKNLKRLHGGAYVRTRATGGPTDEDIYTGLLTGARQIQVVSNSGVFTAEFDPDLRGGRRYSDRARQMVDRYSRLLAAVGSGEVYSEDISPAEQAAIRQKTASGHRNLPAAQVKDLADNEIDAERQRRRFRTLSDDELVDLAETQAREELAGKPGGDAEFGRVRRGKLEQLRAQQAADTVKTYRLDGEGYYAAMKALQQEFPYYVRSVDHTPLPDWLRERGRGDNLPAAYRGTDIGRTRRGGLTPEGAKHRGMATATPAAAAQPESAEQPATEQASGASDKPAASTTAAPWIEAGTKPLSTAVSDERGRFAREISRNVAKVVNLSGDTALSGVFAPVPEKDLADVDPGDDPDYFIAWARRNPEKTGPWLLEDPRRFDVIDRVIKNIRSGGFSDDVYEASGVTDLLEQARTTRTLFASPTKADGDPALTVPENNRPIDIPEIRDLGDRMGNYSRYLDAHPDVAAALRSVRVMDPAQVSEEITDQVERYRGLGKLAADGFDVNESRFSEDDIPDAQEIASLGVNSPQYQQLAALQKAWALHTQQQALAMLTGKPIQQDGEADPKVFGKRQPPSRVTVHRWGSPVSVALAKRQGYHSPKPPR